MLFGKKYWLVPLLFLRAITPLAAQPGNFFYRQGNNISTFDCNEVLFAPLTNQNHQAFGTGSVLVRKPVNLAHDFNVSFILDFVDRTGTDGGAFIFQADPNLQSQPYHGLGIKGVNHSVAITFDVVQNTQFNDPAYDHAGIQANGDIYHNPPNNLIAPVSIEPLYRTTTFPTGEVEKKFTHVITINWKAGLKELSASVDGGLLIRLTSDLVQLYFNNNPVVYWGFAASNTQEQWYPASAEVTWGYMRFALGDIMPRINVWPETDTCYGPPVQVFDASVYGVLNGLSGLSGAQWFWDFGDSIISSVRNPPPHRYAHAGTYIIKLAVTNAFGCTLDTVVRKITLGANPVADFTYSPACTLSPISFTDKSSVADGDLFSWEWTFGNAGTSNSQHPAFTFSTTGPITVYLKVRSNLGCEGDTVKTIIVDEKPVLNATHQEDCFGNVQYKGYLVNNVSIQKWRWEFGDGKRSTEQNPVHHFAQNNQYKTLVWAVSESGCMSDTLIQNVAIELVKAFAGNDTIAVKGKPLQLAGSGNGNYRWAPAAGLSNAFLANPVATLFTNQTYILTVTNSRGCEDSDSIQIKVFNNAEIFVPTAFSPNGDGKNDILVAVAPGFKRLLYFRIYNRWGGMVFESKDLNRGWNGTFQNRSLPPDVYVWVAGGISAEDLRYEKSGTVVLIK